MQYDFRVDWSATWTVTEFQYEFPDITLDFKGPGWYLLEGTDWKGVPNGTDTLLVQATEEPDKFLFMVWNDRDPRQAMLTACMSLPEHHLPRV